MSSKKKYIVGSLWIGNELSNMEIMSINSFLYHGYEYHLYVYDEIKNIPKGVIVKNGNTIINSSEIYHYKNGSVSAFSNLFRFELIYQTGTIWVDMDLICLKYYDFTEKYIIVSIPNKFYDKETIAVSLIKFPAKDPILLDAIQICKQKKYDILNGIMVWGLGPTTMDTVVNKYCLHSHVKPWYFSNSCSCDHVDSIVKPNWTTPDIKKTDNLIYTLRLKNIPTETYFVHLWNDVWRRYKLDKNKKYNNNTMYEDLKLKYLYINNTSITINFYNYTLYLYKKCMLYLCYFLGIPNMLKEE